VRRGRELYQQTRGNSAVGPQSKVGEREEDEREAEEEGKSDDSDDDARPAKRARVDRPTGAARGRRRLVRKQRAAKDSGGELDASSDDVEEEGEKEDEGETTGTNRGGSAAGGRLAARKEKLEAAFEEMATNSRLRYASFTELIYAALRTLGGAAELQQIYDWVGRDENWRRLDKKCTFRTSSTTLPALFSSLPSGRRKQVREQLLQLQEQHPEHSLLQFPVYKAGRTNLVSHTHLCWKADGHTWKKARQEMT
jgi:hypothetical protein